jgi:hypothetical protein
MCPSTIPKRAIIRAFLDFHTSWNIFTQKSVETVAQASVDMQYRNISRTSLQAA